jgi:hypothetical protein
MTSPNYLFDSLCMPDHSLPNMHAADSKDDISFYSLGFSLYLHAGLFAIEYAEASKDDISCLFAC